MGELTSTASQGFTLTVRERGILAEEQWKHRFLPPRYPYLVGIQSDIFRDIYRAENLISLHKTDRQRVPVLEAQGIEIKHETVVFPPV